MSIEGRKFVELPGTTKLLAFHADQQNEGSSNLDPAFIIEGVSELLRSTSSARTYARTNALAERTYTGMRYALSVGHLALGKHFRVPKLARCLGTGTTPANGRSGVVARTPMPMEFGELLKGRLLFEGLRFSVAALLHLASGWTGFKGLRQMWAFPVAIFELGQWFLLAMHVGRIWDCIGPIVAVMTAAIDWRRRIASVPDRMIGTTRCRSIKRARCCMLHEIFAAMAFAFNALADEGSTPPRSRRLLGSHSEKLRSTTETAMPNRWNRTPGASDWGDVWPLSNRLRRRQEFLRLLRTPLCVSSAVGSPDTAVPTVLRS